MFGLIVALLVVVLGLGSYAIRTRRKVEETKALLRTAHNAMEAARVAMETERSWRASVAARKESLDAKETEILEATAGDLLGRAGALFPGVSDGAAKPGEPAH